MNQHSLREELAIQVESFSIIVPTFNGAHRIGYCLEALVREAAGRDVEIIVVDDGSKDATPDVVAKFPGVRLIQQANMGPAGARNRGASEASGSILLFTDDDCVPVPGWLDTMAAPFQDPAVVGAKGAYRTRQSEIIARFVQIEYEDKYRRMLTCRDVDFVDTYSAAFRKERFLEVGGYDTSFPVACAEDVELSYRMSALGWKMRFVPGAVVYHTHPNRLSNYLKKKYKFAFWRMLAVKKNPHKGIKDSHTPQLMKLQLLIVPALAGALLLDLFLRRGLVAAGLVAATFLLSTVPFAVRAFRKDRAIGILSPVLLLLRACAQFLGAFGGMTHVLLKRPESQPIRGSVVSAVRDE